MLPVRASFLPVCSGRAGSGFSSGAAKVIIGTAVGAETSGLDVAVDTAVLGGWGVGVLAWRKFVGSGSFVGSLSVQAAVRVSIRMRPVTMEMLRMFPPCWRVCSTL